MIDRVTLDGKLRLLSEGDIYADAVDLAGTAGRIANSQLQAIRSRAGSIENLVRYLQDQQGRDWADDRWYYKSFFAGVRGAIKRVEERASRLVLELGRPDGTAAASGRSAMPEEPAAIALTGRRSLLSEGVARARAQRRLVRAFVEHFVAELQYRQAPRPRDPGLPPALKAALGRGAGPGAGSGTRPGRGRGGVSRTGPGFRPGPGPGKRPAPGCVGSPQQQSGSRRPERYDPR